LSLWLTDTRCPHYFINKCNLLDNSLNVKNVANKLMSTHIGYLSSWIINNYIGQCAHLCPIQISRLFNEVRNTIMLENVVSKIIHWRLSASLHDMYKEIAFVEYFMTARISHSHVTARSCVYWMTELAKIDQRFCIYFTAIELLHVACQQSRNSFNNGLLDILTIILDSNVSQRCSDLCLRKTEQSTSELVELLQKSAVECLTTYRQLIAREFGSVVTIVTTDFEALHAYKRGDYQRCLQLSTQNVHTLLYADAIPTVLACPEFIQLMNDDIVSLTALTLIVNPNCRDHSNDSNISQLSLSLYQMTQCQLKLHHSVTSLAQTLHYIKVAQIRHSPEYTLDHLTLKLIERKVYLTTLHYS